jgi:hypothetical protein
MSPLQQAREAERTLSAELSDLTNELRSARLRVATGKVTPEEIAETRAKHKDLAARRRDCLRLVDELTREETAARIAAQQTERQQADAERQRRQEWAQGELDRAGHHLHLAVARLAVLTGYAARKRPRDLESIPAIIRQAGVDWSALIEEVENNVPDK